MTQTNRVSWQRNILFFLLNLSFILCSGESLALTVEDKGYGVEEVLVHPFPNKEGNYVVNYVRTGQGTCQILQCGGAGGKKEAVVLDCGGAQEGAIKNGVLKGFLARLIPKNTDVTISISHPDEDHFNRLNMLPSKGVTYNKNVFVGGNVEASKKRKRGSQPKDIKTIYESALSSLLDEDKIKLVFANDLIQNINPNPDLKYDMVNYFTCGDAKLAILYANSITTNANAMSLAIYTNFGIEGALFQGDLIRAEQEKAVKNIKWDSIKGKLYGSSSDDGIMIEVKGETLYSASHHGSTLKDSFFKGWYNKFNPNSVEISVGINGIYKHPREETVDKYEEELKTPVPSHSVSYFGSAQTEGDVDQNVENSLNTIKQNMKKLSLIYAGAPSESEPKRQRTASTPPPPSPPPQQQQQQQQLPPPPPPIPMAWIKSDPPFDHDKEAFAKRISEMLPELESIKTQMSILRWSTGKNKVDVVIKSGDEFIRKLNNDPSTVNGSNMNRYRQKYTALVNAYSQGLPENTNDGKWENKETTQPLYETLSNGSLSYFYSGGSLTNIICYQGSEENLQKCKPALILK